MNQYVNANQEKTMTSKSIIGNAMHDVLDKIAHFEREDE